LRAVSRTHTLSVVSRGLAFLPLRVALQGDAMPAPGPEDEVGRRLAKSLAKGENERAWRLIEGGAVLDLESLLQREDEFRAGQLGLRERFDYSMGGSDGLLILLGLDP